MWEFNKNCNFGMVVPESINDKNPNLVFSMLKSLKQRYDTNIFVYNNEFWSIIIKGEKK